MKKDKRIFAIIPARGGSKGLPHKNICLLDNKPLIVHSILSALQCDSVDRCIVSTEDHLIKRISINYGAEVIDRPQSLAGDEVLIEDVVHHILDELNKKEEMPEYFVLLQPTSPLRTAKHLTECINDFFSSGAACAVSVTEPLHHPYKNLIKEGNSLVPIKDYKSLSMPRQKLPDVYQINGAIYLLGSEVFLEKNTFFVKPIFYFFMDPFVSIDINTEYDLFLAEEIFKQMRKNKL
jgi:CMP-N-acetylneuraminic acid synthetase